MGTERGDSRAFVSLSIRSCVVAVGFVSSVSSLSFSLVLSVPGLVSLGNGCKDTVGGCFVGVTGAESDHRVVSLREKRERKGVGWFVC